MGPHHDRHAGRAEPALLPALRRRRARHGAQRDRRTVPVGDRDLADGVHAGRKPSAVARPWLPCPTWPSPAPLRPSVTVTVRALPATTAPAYTRKSTR